MARMLTAVTGTKMDTAKTFQVNTTVSPDVTVSITTSMLSALEHDDNEFQQLGRRRSTNCHDVVVNIRMGLV